MGPRRARADIPRLGAPAASSATGGTRSLLTQLLLLLASAGLLVRGLGAPLPLAHLAIGWPVVAAWSLWSLAAAALGWQGVALLTARAPAVARGLEALATAALLALFAIVLGRAAGPPHLPSALPSALALQLALQSPDALPPWALDFLILLGWLCWLWLAATLALQLGLSLAEELTHGARWVRRARGVADRLTLPIIRRVAHEAVVAATVLQLASRASPVAAAPAPTAAASMADRPMHAHGALAPTTVTPLAPAGAPRQPKTPEAGAYTVQPGDNLWLIAARLYGDGERWPTIYAANVGHPMRDGATFPRDGVIQEGWILRIPARAPGAPAVQQETYTVQPGDNLSLIARRFYGDERAWPRLFAANRGARLPDGRTLTDPNLIWPELRLVIPGGAQETPASPTTATRATPPVAHGASKPTVRTPAVTQRAAAPSVAITPAAASRSAPAAAPSATTTAMARAAAASTAAPATNVTPAATAAPAASPAPTPAPAPAPGTPSPAAKPALPPPLFAPGAAGLAAALAGAGAILLARRRFRSSLAEPPIPPDADAGVLIRDGYADAAHASTFAGMLDGGAEPAVLVAEQALAWLAAEGLGAATLVAVEEGRHTLRLTFQGDLALQARLLALGPDLAERLGARGDAVRTADHDVVVWLRDLTLLRLGARPGPGPVPAVPLIALGVLPDGAVLHANWRRLGHVLLAGSPGGVDVLLASVLAALAARCHPDALRLWLIAPRAAVPPALLDLPHGCDRGVEPDDDRGVGATIAAVRAELERRMNAGPWHGPTPDEPELLLAVRDPAAVADGGLLEVLGRYGHVYGVRLLVAADRPETLPESLLEAFQTRLVLRTDDEAASVRLLGRPDAADLGGGGDLWARIAERAPVRLCGLRVEPDFLDRLVDRMHAAFAGTDDPPPNAPAAAPTPGAEGRIAASAAESTDAGKATEPSRPAPAGAATATEDDDPPLAAAIAVQDTDADEIAAIPAQDGQHNGVIRNGVVPAAGDAVRTPASGAPPSEDAMPLPSITPEVGASLLQVTCFGQLRVASGERVLSSRGQQVAWELLVYLALHTRGDVAKEDLLPMLWPGADPADAAPRIQGAMKRLRRILADQVPGLPGEVVRIDRNGACRLDAELVWSDAQQFLAWYAAARQTNDEARRLALLDAARRLARDGLFQQVGFRWLDQRRRGLSLRQHFHELATEVTTDLARGWMEAGNPERAAPLYRELLAEEPTLQAIARELYACYGALGDRLALVAEHEQLARALAWRRRQAEQAGRPALGGGLEAATVATYEAVLARLDGVPANAAND